MLKPDFFNRPVTEVAPDLLGAHLVVQTSAGAQRSRITEVEAYDGTEDKACHASRGRTPRTEVMFGDPGVLYIYLVYGMYTMLNVVTGERDYPAAVLVRGTEAISGPGRLTRDFQIERSLNALPAAPESGVWFEQSGTSVCSDEIQKTPRIGVAYAGGWADAKYRFVWKKKGPAQ